MSVKEVGETVVGFRYAEFKWKISNFFSVIKDENIKNYESRMFRFEDATWYFDLCLTKIETVALFPGVMSLHLHFITDPCPPGYCIKYNFGLQKVDGSVAKEIKGVLTYASTTSERCIFKVSEIIQKRLELAPSNILTITCTLKMVPIASTLQEKSAEPRQKKLRTLDTLSENFKSLLKHEASCDTILYVKEKEYKAHKAVLIARSSVFAAMLQHEMSEKQTGIINIPDCDTDSFKDFLEFLYCGKIEQLSPCKAYCLYETSDKYNVQDLKALCNECLKENLTTENVCEIAIFADEYDDINLKSAVQDFFDGHVNEIFQTSQWECLLKNNYCLANTLLKEMAKVKFPK